MESPKGRHMHSLSKVNNKYYTYGGISLPDNKVLNDLWILNCDNVVWNTTLAEMSGAVWTQKQATGSLPGPLKGHTAVYYKNQLVIFGGEDDKGQVNDNLYFLDTESMVWTMKEVKGKGRTLHQMQVVAEEYLVVSFGVREGKVCNDVCLLDLKVTEWKEIKLNGTSPSPRYAHSLAVSEELESVIFGGVKADNSLANNDLFVLKVSSDKPEDNKEVKEETESVIHIEQETIKEELEVKCKEEEIDELLKCKDIISIQEQRIASLEKNVKTLKESMYVSNVEQ
jgi:hypothetical protein